jgi:large subunit ribosomal protein L31
MKADIHPSYAQVKVTCSCGEIFNTRSTSGKDISIEVCSVCHPFYTGKQKIVDTAGRVERFKQKYANRGVKTGE